MRQGVDHMAMPYGVSVLSFLVEPVTIRLPCGRPATFPHHRIKPLRRICFLIVCLGCVLLVSGWGYAQDAVSTLPMPTARKLPRWRGFNLDDKFYLRRRQRPFRETDFQMIHELGFNFVRLPMDYRNWIVEGDWTRFNEDVLKQIDEAVAFGKKYDIHVSINFHRAPGYTVAKPPEPTDLWTDAKTQEVCAMHWAEFARRYRGIPNTHLSFNPFNEPSHIAASTYVNVVQIMVDAIRKQDPDRLIICDGINWGSSPVSTLRSLNVAQATRGYKPMEVTHYKADWVESQAYAYPSWPMIVAQGTLYSPTKAGMSTQTQQDMIINGPFAKETNLKVRVGTVSNQATLQVLADRTVLWEKAFLAGPGEGEWKQTKLLEQWNVYHSTYDMDYPITIPAGTSRVSLRLTAGDWLRITQLAFTANDQPEHVLTLDAQWDKAPAVITYHPAQSDKPFSSSSEQGRHWLWQQNMPAWIDIQSQGVGVMVGEFGCYNRTPHAVALAWMEDNLANWKQAGWGWALWNFRGSFGILNSHRRDVEYEDFHGYRLDRKMLELLQKY